MTCASEPGAREAQRVRQARRVGFAEYHRLREAPRARWFCSPSRQARKLAHSPSRRRRSAGAQAAPRPAMPTIFSVPARSPCSWPPPRTTPCRRWGRPGAKQRAPTPLGPPNLCAEIARASTPKSLMITCYLAGGLDRVADRDAACGLDDRGGLRDGLEHDSGLVVGGLQRQHHRTTGDLPLQSCKVERAIDRANRTVSAVGPETVASQHRRDARRRSSATARQRALAREVRRQHHVQRFRAARGEDHVLDRRARQRRDLSAASHRPIDGPRGAPLGVDRRGVAGEIKGDRPSRRVLRDAAASSRCGRGSDGLRSRWSRFGRRTGPFGRLSETLASRRARHARRRTPFRSVRDRRRGSLGTPEVLELF